MSVLDVEVLEDLMLTENTRVFKAGVFWLDQDVLKIAPLAPAELRFIL